MVIVMTYILGLLSKPMVVTFPFVLLLLDIWPLRRINLWNLKSAEGSSSDTPALPPGKILLEKVPLMALAGVFSVVTILAQSEGGAVTPLEGLSITSRIGSAFFAYSMYVWKAIYPSSLAVIYPHPQNDLEMQHILFPVVLFLTMTVISLMKLKKAPFFAVGWFWFVGTLVPVIGLVQVGKQYMADRYTYIPHIGLFIVFVWGIDLLSGHLPKRDMWLKSSSAVILAGMMFVSRGQVEHWRDTAALFEHALQSTEDNYAAEYYLGLERNKQGHTDEAIEHFSRSARIKPSFFEARLLLGNALLQQERTDEAIRYYAEAWRLQPGHSSLPFNLGLAYWQKGDMANSESNFRMALRLNKDHVKANVSLGKLLYRKGSFEEALKYLETSLEGDPSNATAHTLAADISRQQGNREKAVYHYREALRIQPGLPKARTGLSELLMLSPGNSTRQKN